MLFIPLDEGKVFLNVPLFKQAQLCFFIHLYAQDWLVAHMLSQKNKAGQDGSHALSDSKVNEEVLSSFLVAPIWRGNRVSTEICNAPSKILSFRRDVPRHVLHVEIDQVKIVRRDGILFVAHKKYS